MVIKKGKNTIHKNSFLIGFNYIENSVVGKCEIYCSKIVNSIICDECRITNSVIENSVVRNGSTVGPFSYLRQNSFVGKNCRIGDFVEVKNSCLDDGVKASHHAYVGDAYVGKNTNIGCGTVFANFNGKIKQKTFVGENVFIGANVNLVAPVSVGKNSFIGAGTTVRENLDENTFLVDITNNKIKKIEWEVAWVKIF